MSRMLGSPPHLERVDAWGGVAAFLRGMKTRLRGRVKWLRSRFHADEFKNRL